MSPRPLPRRRAAGRAAALAVTLAVAACAGHPPQEGRDRTPPARADYAAPASAVPAAIPVAAAPDAPDLQESRSRDAEPQAERGPLPEPATLGGLSGDEVRKLLGAPAFARSDPPAALWQYRQDGCLLDLYLYADNGGHRVRHFEFRADPGAKSEDAQVDARRCYAGLLRAQARAAAR